MPKGAKTVLRNVRLREISAVDRPAQEHARMVIAKRAPDEITKRMYLTSVADGHQHVIDENNWEGFPVDGGSTSWSKSEGEGEGHSHPWVRMADGSIVIGMAEGHSHDILNEQTMKSAPRGEGDEVMKMRSLALAGLLSTTALMGVAGEQSGAAGGDKTKAAVGPSAEEFAELQKSLARVSAVADMDDRTKAFFTGLPTDRQTAFIAKSAADRLAEVDAAERNKAASDPVEYRATDGTEYRKSAGTAVINLAKALDTERATSATEREKNAIAEFTKAAETTYGNLPGDATAKAKALIVLAKMDPASAEVIKTMLVAGNKAVAEAMKAAGRDGGAEPESGGGATSEKNKAVVGLTKSEKLLHEKALEVQKANAGMSYEVAYSKALDDNGELYSASLREKAAIVAQSGLAA